MVNNIIFILGPGRNGSTLLEALLNQHDSTVSVGEVYRYWERFYKRETLCSCREKIQQCKFWSAVNEEILNNYPHPLDLIKSEIKEVLKYKNFYHLNKPNHWKTLRGEVKNLYQAIFNISDNKIIIDSSKSPSWGIFLDTIPDFKVHFIDLRRNLVEVGNSWKKKKVLKEYYDKEVYMPIKKDFQIIKEYIKTSILISRISKKSQYLITVQYEDLCNHTDRIIDSIWKSFEIAGSDKMNGTSRFSHSIAGNPEKFNFSAKPEVYQYSSTNESLNFIQKGMFNVIQKLIH